MNVEIPDHIAEEFFILLDIAQSLFSEEQVAKMTSEEQACLKYVNEALLGKNASARYETTEQAKQISKNTGVLLREVL